MKGDSLLTVREVADYLHVVTMTVYRMIDRGDLNAVKVGRVWRIRREELEQYLDRSMVHDTNPKETTG